MIRMTLLLVFGIGIAMLTLGNTSNMPQGSDAGGPDLVDNDGSGGLLSKVGALIGGSDEADQEDERIPLKDESRAIEIALAATVTPDAPPEARSRVVKVSSGPAAAAVVAAPDPEGTWYVTGSRVNLRAGPSTSESVVGRVVLGQKAEMLEETDNGWYHIRTAGGAQDGFIYSKFLSTEQPG